MTKHKILFAGESWVNTTTHINGFDHFSTASYAKGAGAFLDAMAGSDFDVTYMSAEQALSSFPQSMEKLKNFDAVVLSDIGSNTLLLHPDTSRGLRAPNRLRLIRDYVDQGGGFLMLGGYCSFQGFQSIARYHKTPIEDILPVNCLPYDDRQETPEGVNPEMVPGLNHPILEGIAPSWPHVLGFNEVVAKPGASVLVTASEDYARLPLLVTGTYGKGRTVAWTSDIGPHWLPNEFLEWSGYRVLWQRILSWVVGDL